MKKYKNITIGGIQQKIFNLVLITVILMMVVNSVVILHQSRQLSSLVEETSTAQKQSMAEISDQPMTEEELQDLGDLLAGFTFTAN